jgi:hypothetical protein
MFFIPVFLFLIAMVAGIWLLTKLTALKGINLTLAKIGAWIIVVISLLLVIFLIIMGCVTKGGGPCSHMYGPPGMGPGGEKGPYPEMMEKEDIGFKQPPPGMTEGEKEAPPETPQGTESGK